MSINNKNDKYNKYITSNLIPSSTLHSYYIDNHINLTEDQLIECATMYGHVSLIKQRNIYTEVLADTDNQRLRNYLENEIWLIEFYMKKVSETCDNHTCVLYKYDSMHEDPQEIGVYKNQKDAEQAGLRSGSWFSIERHIVRDTSADLDTKTNDGDDNLELCIDYNIKGEIIAVKYFQNDDVEYQDIIQKAQEIGDYLDETYCKFPVPFEHGDLVQIVNYNGKKPYVGIVYVDGAEEIQALLDKGIIPSNELYCEFCDESGNFDSAKIPSIHLEKVTIEEAPLELRDLLASASCLVKGKGSISDFQFFLNNLDNQ